LAYSIITFEKLIIGNNFFEAGGESSDSFRVQYASGAASDSHRQACLE
jgi:hypothetical protein